MSEDWPFSDPPNVWTFTLSQIVREGKPILHVSHDEDGTWQFLDGGTPRMKEAMVVALHTIVELDPSVRELADLPDGWRAFRRARSEPWRRERNEE